MKLLIEADGIGTIEIVEGSHAYYETDDGKAAFFDEPERPDTRTLQDVIQHCAACLLDTLRQSAGSMEEPVVYIARNAGGESH